MTKRKTVTMLVTVSAPARASFPTATGFYAERAVTPADIRREVRSLINDQCNYALDEGEVRVLRIAPARVVER